MVLECEAAAQELPATSMTDEAGMFYCLWCSKRKPWKELAKLRSRARKCCRECEGRIKAARRTRLARQITSE